MTLPDIPKDYMYVDWEHLERHIGRVILGNHVPMMSKKVADYLVEQARELRYTADKLDRAAEAMRRP